jgi:hypothetical protein
MGVMLYMGYMVRFLKGSHALYGVWMKNIGMCHILNKIEGCVTQRGCFSKQQLQFTAFCMYFAVFFERYIDILLEI